MEHVRLPLVSKEYILEKVVNEPLLKNNPKCMYTFYKNTYLMYII